MYSYNIFYKEDQISIRIARYIEKKISIKKDIYNPTFLFILGGDGTFLKTCKLYKNSIFILINTGSLGHFSNYNISDIDGILEDIKKKNINYEYIKTLDVLVESNNTILKENIINDICFTTSGKKLECDILINNILLENFFGLGLVICSSMGSCALNKSLNGAIIDSNLDLLEITKIGAINSKNYSSINNSYIFDSTNLINLRIKDSDIKLSLDCFSFDFTGDVDIKIKYSDFKYKIFSNKRISFIERFKRSFIENIST